MNAQDVMNHVTEAMHVRRVFGEPFQLDGRTIIPVAAVMGGWGGGFGQGQQANESGWGAGGGLSARPVGVFVVTGEDVTWQPSVDVNRLGLVLGALLLLLIGSTVRGWGRRRRQ